MHCWGIAMKRSKRKDDSRKREFAKAIAVKKVPQDRLLQAKELKSKVYDRDLATLQVELVKLGEYVRVKGLKVAVVFEGRDAAGKGGVIKRIMQRMNPRTCRIVALGTPTEREKTQWYFQRYVAELPAAGEIVLFDRSWYNRAGVDFNDTATTEKEYQEFM